MVKKITTWSYLEPLIYKKEFMHLAEISAELGKPHATVRKHLNNFEKLGLLVKTTKGRLTVYRLNFNAPLCIDYLALVEKERLVNKCNADLMLNELVSFLHQHLKEKNHALIFGSAVADSKKANDIDLLITGKIDFEGELEQFEKKFNVTIHLINANALTEIGSALTVEIVKKHLIVHGSEEIIKWLL